MRLQPYQAAIVVLIIVVIAFFVVRNDGNDSNQADRDFILINADKSVGPSNFPIAIDPKQVGSYPAYTKSGAGYFYDDVLEYRVWVHPERGGKSLNGGQDYYYAFAQYEQAADFSKKTPGAEKPLVLVRQKEWINEPTPGQYVHEKGERLTEWQVQWLKDDKRTLNGIEEFMKHPRPIKTDDEKDDDD